MPTEERTVRKVINEFSPVDGCAPMFNFNCMVWMERAMLEIIEQRGDEHFVVRSLPNGRILTAKKEDILTKTEIIK